jgi:broad specificity phosphatase PhoE
VAYASDLQRAWQTAEAIRQAREPDLPSLSLTPDARLRELNFGDWEGLTRVEIAERFPESQRAWQTDPLRARLPNGESVLEAAARVNGFLLDMIERHSDQTVLIVTHGGALQIFCCLFCNGNLSLRRHFRFANASLSAVRLAARGAEILLLNDAHHLAQPPAIFP